MKYRKEIDGLRALAVLPVIFFHAGIDIFSGGYVGVDVFFVISGFLITSLILNAMSKSEFSFSHFYERRARRILPALFATLFFVTPFAFWLMTPAQLVDFAQSIISSVFFFSNFHFFLEDGYFSASSELKPMLHTWSLAIEEQFYLLFPSLLILLATKFKQSIVLSLFGLSLFSFMFAQWGGNLSASYPFIESKFEWFDQSFLASYYMPFGRLWELLVGAILALVLVQRENVKSLSSDWMALCGVCLIISAIVFLDHSTPFPSVYTLLPVFGTLLVLTYGTSSTMVGRALSSPAFVFLGTISYSLYLFHQPILAIIRLTNPDILNDWRIITVLLSIFGVSYISWRYIETPFRIAKQINNRVLIIWFSMAVTVSSGFAVATILSNGFLHRFQEDDRALLSVNEAEMAKYTPKKFLSLRLQNFETARRKILLIGDSFAMDFLNMAYEGGYWRDASVSTHHIERQCGIVLTAEDFSHHINDSDRANCIRRGRFESQQVRNLIREADIIFLASRWSKWVADYIPDTVKSLKNLGAKQIVIIGSKNIGKVNPMSFVGTSLDDKRQAKALAESQELAIIQEMSKLSSDYQYLDVQSLICPSFVQCPVFTDRGELISFDGKHLTIQGASYFSDAVFSSPLLTFLDDDG